MKYQLPPLPYSYDALEPFIDEQTMRIHHTKHHQSYVDKLNAALAEYPELAKQNVEELLSNLPTLTPDIQTAVRNFGGGHANHSFFWLILHINKGEPKNEIIEAIKQQFGSFNQFKIQFSNNASALFGSGWTWLVVDANKKLQIVTAFNQDSPLTQGQKPLLALDIWEHAYYLKYQNRRPDYIEAFFHIINWDKVNELYLETIK